MNNYSERHYYVVAVASGGTIGVLGGLIGLGGAEFRLPTMLVGFTRYSRDDAFAVIKQNKAFVLVMAAGSLVGSWVGGHLLGIVPGAVLLPLLAAILVVSAWKVWRHE